MFAVLDTNHYNELAFGSVFGRNVQARIEKHRADVFISIVSVQESIQGWMAVINRKRAGREQVHAYARFQKCIEALTRLTILPFDEAAARVFENLKRQRLRSGTMDLKIAAICIAHDALLLTRNLSDFEKDRVCAWKTGWIEGGLSFFGNNATIRLGRRDETG